MPKTVAQFRISSTDGGYLLHIEDEDGETTEFTASYEALDLIAEAIDDQLDRDAGEFDEVEDSEAED